MAAPLALYQVDAFTDRPFAGNPAAVVPLEAPAPEPWMQRVAAEMNLSETAFVHPEADAWRLRWFTPNKEVDLCGHATLATAHILWERGLAPEKEVLAFETRSGRLTAAPTEDGWIAMDLPAYERSPVEPPHGLTEALGAEPRDTWESRGILVAELDDAATVEKLTPDITALAAYGNSVLVTAAGDGEADYVLRYFAPQYGIPEDPITGSAQCALGPLWAERVGKESLVAHQVSKRGGVLCVRVRGERVEVAGQAVTVLEGRLLAGP